MVNGSPSHFFQSFRGIRQGAPISHVLFTIMAESLGSYLQKMVRDSSLKGLHPSSDSTIFLHQLFIDDRILMGTFAIREAITFKKSSFPMKKIQDSS